MGLQTAGWVMDIIRVIFGSIDWIVYSLVKLILFGIFDLSSLTTASGIMNGIYARIYVILGIFMAFKLSFSFFQYIVDPESMSGKSEKGVSKLISRTIIMLLVLVSVPSILFGSDEGGGLIQRAQKAFLPMLPRLLLGINEDSGVSIDNGNNTDDIASAADTMAVSTLRAFFAPSQELDSACGQGTYADTPQITSVVEFLSNLNLTCSAGINVDLVLVQFGSAKYYKYTYNFLVSTIVGILLVLMLLGITIDIAKRVFKLIILEVVAPIPIMSLIDPKSSKDGAFSHWLKSLISTFLDIFIKLGLLYVIIMLVQLIVNQKLFQNYPEFFEDPLRASYLTVILILGLIFFAKEAPKFIKDSLGIKDSGAGLGTGLGAAVGAVGGLVGGRSLSGMLTGAVAGASADPKQGAWAAGRDTAGKIRTGDKNYSGGLGATLQRATVKRQGVREARKLGITAGDNGTLKAAKNYMIQTESNEQDAKMKYEEALHRGASEDTINQLRDNYVQAQSTAASAKRQYETMSKVGETYGLSESKQDEQKRKNFHKAVRNTVNRVERIPIVGKPLHTAINKAENIKRYNELGSNISWEEKFQQKVADDRVITYDNAIQDSRNRATSASTERDVLRQDIFGSRNNRNNSNNNNNNNNNNP